MKRRGHHRAGVPTVTVVRCVTGKTGFTRGEAERRLAAYRERDVGTSRRPPTRIYKCDRCDHWHLTSQRPGGDSMTDDQLRHELTVARNRLGNAVGAIIDSGGYCTGPEDVAAAIGRLTAERDAERALADRLASDLTSQLTALFTTDALDEWRQRRGA